MGAVSFIKEVSLVEIMILGFIAMNMGVSAFYLLHRGLKKATAASNTDD